MPPDGRTLAGRASRKDDGAALQRRDPFTVAVRRALDDQGLSQVVLAAALGVSEATASRALNDIRGWSLDDAVAVTGLLGPRPLSLLLERHGYAVTPLEDAAGSDGVVLDSLHLAGAVGSLQEEVADAIADGRVDRMEAARLREDVRTVLEKARTMLVALDAIAGGA